MLSDLRKNLDVLLVVMVALLAYHLYKKASGDKKGISK